MLCNPDNSYLSGIKVAGLIGFGVKVAKRQGMGFQNDRSESIPPVRLLSEVGQVRPSAEPPALGNFRQLRIEQFLSLKNLAANSKRNYQRQLKAFIDWCDKEWQDVTMNDVRRYKDYLEGDRGLKPASVGAAIAALKSMFGWLIQANLISVNPTAAVSIPKPPESVGKHLESFQVEDLFKALEGRGKNQRRDRAILCCLILAGMRAEEISNLNVGDYNGVELVVRQAKHDSVGFIPVDGETHRAICELLQERRFEMAGELTPDLPLFVSSSNRNLGQRLGYEGIYKLVRDIAKQAGWPEIHPHRGRHTFASDLITGGMDAYLAMMLTRNRSVKVFQKYSAGVRYQMAKQRFLEMKGEEERQPMSLEEMSRL